MNELIGKYINGYKIVKVEQDPFLKDQINLFTEVWETNWQGDKTLIVFRVRNTESNYEELKEMSEINVKSALINQQENKQLKEQIKELELIVGLRQKRNLISKFDKEYDEEDKKKNPNRDYVGITPDAEEVYKRYYKQKKVIEEVRKTIVDYLITEDYCSGKCLDLSDVIDNIFKIIDKAKENK